MGWVLFEIAMALAVAVAIVWWTLPKKDKPRTGAAREDEKR